MKKNTFTIIDPIGLHARPASFMVKTASKFKSNIFLCTSNEKKGNLKSIMSILALGVKTNQEIILEVDGEDEEQAMEEMIKIMKEQKII